MQTSTRITSLSDEDIYSLALRAKDDPSLIPALWDAVEPMVRIWAYKRMIRVGDRGTRLFEIDDLVQVGYLALVDAVDGYDPEKGVFWVIFHFKHTPAFYRSCGWRKQVSP